MARHVAFSFPVLVRLQAFEHGRRFVEDGAADGRSVFKHHGRRPPAVLRVQQAVASFAVHALQRAALARTWRQPVLAALANVAFVYSTGSIPSYPSRGTVAAAVAARFAGPIYAVLASIAFGALGCVLAVAVFSGFTDGANIHAIGQLCPPGGAAHAVCASLAIGSLGTEKSAAAFFADCGLSCICVLPRITHCAFIFCSRRWCKIPFRAFAASRALKSAEKSCYTMI